MGSTRRQRKAQPRKRVDITEALFTTTQARVFALIFGQANRSFRMMELINLANCGFGSVQREIKSLVHSGLVTCTATGRDRVYQANRAAPVFAELESIITKTVGLVPTLQAALTPIVERIQLALLYGSVAQKTDTADSDIDVLLVADDLTLEEVFGAVAVAERKLGRRVDPIVLRRKEFASGIRTPFLKRVLAGKYVVLAGRIA